MSRSPKALPTPANDGFNPERLEAAGEAAQQLATLQQHYAQGRDLVNQLLGQAQMADAFSQFSLTVRTSKLKIVKENKLHQHLAGSVTPDGQELKGTWAEFCALMKVSVQKADEDITNFRAFGEEALESMSKVGIGYRELRQFRKLPADQKTALIEMAESGDKDALLDLAEDLIARHTKEKEALTQRAEEAEANLEARARVLEDKNVRIDQLTEEIAKVRQRVKALPPADVGEEIRKEVTMLAAQAEVGIRAMRAGLQALVEHGEAHGIDHGDFTAGLICQLELALRQLRGEFGVKAAPDGDDTPEWLRPGASEAAAARVAADMADAGWRFDAEGHMVPADADLPEE